MADGVETPDPALSPCEPIARLGPSFRNAVAIFNAGLVRLFGVMVAPDPISESRPSVADAKGLSRDPGRCFGTPIVLRGAPRRVILQTAARVAASGADASLEHFGVDLRADPVGERIFQFPSGPKRVGHPHQRQSTGETRAALDAVVSRFDLPPRERARSVATFVFEGALARRCAGRRIDCISDTGRAAPDVGWRR